MLNIKITVGSLRTNMINWGEHYSKGDILHNLVKMLNLYFPLLQAELISESMGLSLNVNTNELLIEINKIKKDFALITTVKSIPLADEDDFFAIKFNPILAEVGRYIPYGDDKECFFQQAKLSVTPSFDLFGEVLTKIVAKFSLSLELNKNLPLDVNEIIVNYVGEVEVKPLDIGKCKLTAQRFALFEWPSLGSGTTPPAFAQSIVKYCLSIFPGSADIKDNAVRIHKAVLNSNRFAKDFRRAVGFFSPVKLQYQAQQHGFNSHAQETIIKSIDEFDSRLNFFVYIRQELTPKVREEFVKLRGYVKLLKTHFSQNPIHNLLTASLEELTENLLLSNQRIKQNLPYREFEGYMKECQSYFNQVFFVLERVNRVFNVVMTDNNKMIFEDISFYKGNLLKLPTLFSSGYEKLFEDEDDIRNNQTVKR